MLNWLREPKNRIKMALVIFFGSLIGWPATHIVMLIEQPAGTNTWVFHLLLALSWLAITFTAVDILATTDVRKEVSKDE
jgi:hypothetical protein